jgi:hypothetical protein
MQTASEVVKRLSDGQHGFWVVLLVCAPFFFAIHRLTEQSRDGGNTLVLAKIRLND